MGFKYLWKELTGEGELLEPVVYENTYRHDSVNKEGPFETEELAVEAYKKFKKVHGFNAPWDLVLIKIYEIEFEDN